MSMTFTRPGPRTRGAQVLAEFLPLHEEHAPQGFGLRPEAAVLQVADHVGDAARLACDEGDSPLLAAVPLTWAAATALAAVPRLRADDDVPAARAKDALLMRIDRIAGRRLSQAAECSVAELVTRVQAALGPAFAALSEAERRPTAAGSEDMADALLETATWAVVAAEVLEARSG